MFQILMVLPIDNFQDVEYLTPRQWLNRAGASISTASTTRLPIRGAEGTELRTDLLLSEVEVKHWDGVIFVGGWGARSLWTNHQALRIARQAFDQQRVVAGICLGAVMPFLAGVGQHYRATTYPDVSQDLIDRGGQYQERSVVVDGHLVTGAGPESAEEFAQAIWKTLQSNSK